MAEVVVYTKPGCPYCTAAMALLKRKGVDFTEIVASRDPEIKAQMVARANGASTFPQIFVGEKHIGGSDDIHALDARGGLDPLLAA
ncbi:MULTISPECIES: glutaredoxin 3 [unclassified Brevundimonas]|uniref:glutaredoxin 3 n=1 Tax=unclassified Brevundimonas TaxID=2622653 RepID=UPI003F912F1C